jgi:hypothetical protein
MIERLRNVINWMAFLCLIYPFALIAMAWLGIYSNIPDSLHLGLDWLIILVFPGIYIFIKIVEYVIFGKPKFLPFFKKDNLKTDEK